jgi:protein Tex
MGERSFQQSAGFLRIRDGSNPLDAGAVHPENYQVVQKMARNLKVDLPALIGNSQLIAKLDPNAFVTPDTGLPTITDILKELEKPGRDPRNTFSEFKFNKEIRTINDIKPGMVLPAIVTNITAFGAFVDLGIHESGLIHKSKIAPEFVSDPAAYLRINQKLEVKVLEVDTERKRIALSLVDL